VASKQLTGAGDLRRSLELLWRRPEPGRRGPKPRLSTDEVVGAAIRLADASGVEALSMRKVAEAVGVSPMSLYTYVPSKAELLDLMVDRALGEAADPDDSVGGWRARLAFIARERWALTERHPWLLDLALHRPPLGPNVMQKAEQVLRVFEGMGLEAEEMGLAADALQNYVTGALHAARAAREAERRTGMTDEQWLASIGELLKGRLDAGAYPVVRRLGEGGGGRARGDAAGRFAFGLERVLDGLEAFIRARGGTP
jgi:AcrR family transcriptional regulator